MSTILTGRISGSAAIADPLTDLDALERWRGRDWRRAVPPTNGRSAR
jgi:hypothetical protein